MKTNKKLVHLYIIISCLVLAIGAAMGTVFHFIGSGFFNYGVENNSGASVEVNYNIIDYAQSTVDDICTAAFESNGLSGYTCKYSEIDGYIEYAFSSGVNADSLNSAVEAINNSLAGANEGYSINLAAAHVFENVVTNSNYYIWGAVVAAIAIGVQAVYVAIRYKISMAAVSIISNAHSILLLAAILAITRIPFGSYFVAIAALCLLINIICQQLYYSRVKVSLKNAEDARPASEKVASEAKANFKNVTWFCVAMLIVCTVFAIGIAIAAFSLSALAPALAAICACVVCWYSAAAFTPALLGGITKDKAVKNTEKTK